MFDLDPVPAVEAAKVVSNALKVADDKKQENSNKKGQVDDHTPVANGLKETHIRQPDSVPAVDIANILGYSKDKAETTKGEEEHKGKGFPYWS